MKEAGAKRALILPVGGAFHSPMMEPAREELAAAIEATTFSTPICPVYQNVTANAVSDPAEIKKNLIIQLTAPVKWTQSVQQMIKDGATSFTEVGPGTSANNRIGNDVTAQWFECSFFFQPNVTATMTVPVKVIFWIYHSNSTPVIADIFTT